MVGVSFVEFVPTFVTAITPVVVAAIVSTAITGFVSFDGVVLVAGVVSFVDIVVVTVFVSAGIIGFVSFSVVVSLVGIVSVLVVASSVVLVTAVLLLLHHKLCHKLTTNISHFAAQIIRQYPRFCLRESCRNWWENIVKVDYFKMKPI